MSDMPTWEGFMTHALDVLSDGSVRSLREICDLAAQRAGLSDEQLREELASGQSKYVNRVGWAASYLANVGALARPKRGQYVITEAGRRVLNGHPHGLRERDFEPLANDPTTGISAYVPGATTRTRVQPPSIEPTELDPTEQVEQGVARI